MGSKADPAESGKATHHGRNKFSVLDAGARSWINGVENVAGQLFVGEAGLTMRLRNARTICGKGARRRLRRFPQYRLKERLCVWVEIRQEALVLFDSTAGGVELKAHCVVVTCER